MNQIGSSLAFIASSDQLFGVPHHRRPIISLPKSFLAKGLGSDVAFAYTFMYFLQNVFGFAGSDTFKQRLRKRSLIAFLLTSQASASFSGSSPSFKYESNKSTQLYSTSMYMCPAASSLILFRGRDSIQISYELIGNEDEAIRDNRSASVFMD